MNVKRETVTLMDDQEALDALLALKNKGYTPDEVERAYQEYLSDNPSYPTRPAPYAEVETIGQSAG